MDVDMGTKEWDSMIASLEANEEFDRRQEFLAEEVPMRRQMFRVFAENFLLLTDRDDVDAQLRSLEQVRAVLNDLDLALKAEKHAYRY